MEIRDPIYGFISINDFEKEIIDSPVFQRLRRIQTLGLTSMAYPGAVHTRFEHSLGVMHLAGLMYDAITAPDRNQKILRYKLRHNKKRIEEDKQLVRIAALLHDVGHGPFSHVAEEVMPYKKDQDTSSKKKKRFTHEDYTVAVINGPLKETIEDSQSNKFAIDAKQIAEVFERGGRNAFWIKAIISSQLDADRGDYLLRDSHHIGVKYGIYDHERLLNTLTLGQHPEEPQVAMLGVNREGLRVAESFVIARYLEYTQVTFHKTRKAYDFHLEKAMKSILCCGLLPPPYKIDQYLKYDDFTIFNQIKEKKDSNEDCLAIIDRKHIRCIHSETARELNDVESRERFEMAITEAREQLKQEGITWSHVDRILADWYRKKDYNEEILIIDDKDPKKTPQLLSERSNIVNNIGCIAKWRLYVKLSEKEGAEIAWKKITKEKKRKAPSKTLLS
jgi:hypothetical protein